MSIDDIQWDLIAPRLTAETYRLQTGSIPDRSFWILKAVAAAKNSSVNALTASLLNAQVRRWEESWFKDIQFVAARYNLTFEEAFVKLALGEPLYGESDETVE